MTDYLSIGEAAKAVHTTSETLRHYDRIGLVKPSKKDEWTNYRYYPCRKSRTLWNMTTLKKSWNF